MTGHVNPVRILVDHYQNLIITSLPIVYKYCEGKMKSALIEGEKT